MPRDVVIAALLSLGGPLSPGLDVLGLDRVGTTDGGIRWVVMPDGVAVLDALRVQAHGLPPSIVARVRVHSPKDVRITTYTMAGGELTIEDYEAIGVCLRAIKAAVPC